MLGTPLSIKEAAWWDNEAGEMTCKEWGQGQNLSLVSLKREMPVDGNSPDCLTLRLHPQEVEQEARRQESPSTDMS